MPAPKPLPKTLASLLDRYEHHLRYERHLGDATIADTCATLARFWRSARVRKPARVTDVHYYDFLNAPPDPANGATKGARLTPNTRLQYGTRILACYRYMAAERWITVNPLRRISPERPAPPVARDAPVDTIVRLANTLGADLRLLVAVLLCYLAGLRRAEVVDLRIEDCELDGAEPVLLVLGKGRGGGKQRIVPIHRLLLGPLRQLVAGRAAGPLLPNLYNPARKLTADYLGKLFRRAATDAGLAGLTPHMLRHSCATHLMNEGATERELCDLLGWSGVEMVRRYTTSHRSRLHRTVARMPVVCASKAADGGGHRVAERPPQPAPTVPPPRREPGVRCRGRTARRRRR